MARRSPHTRLRRQATIIVLIASTVIFGGVAVWWSQNPDPETPNSRGNVRQAPESKNLRPDLESARTQLNKAASSTLPDRLNAYLSAQERLAAQTGAPSQAARLEQLTAIHQSAYGTIDLMPRILTLCDEILRMNPEDPLATHWRLAGLLAQAPAGGPVSPSVENAWKAATELAPKDARLYQLFCDYLRTGSERMRDRALHTAEDAVTATNSFGCRLLLLEIQLAAATPESKGPIERRILAFQRRPPKDLPADEIVRLARLSALADALPVADAKQTLAAGILRAQRLLADALKQTPDAPPLLRAAAMQAVWAGQPETAIAHAENLKKLNTAGTSIHDVVAQATHQRYGNLIVGLAQLQKLRLIDANVDLKKDRERFNAAYSAIVANTGEKSWEAQLLLGMTHVLIGNPDSGIRILGDPSIIIPSQWHAIRDSWLGFAYWQSGDPQGAIARFDKLPTASALPVPLRREAAELLIRSHLLLKNLHAAKAAVPILEGLVQRDAPLDHANLLIHLVQSVVEKRASNPLSVLSALRRLEKSGASHTTGLLNAAFAQAISQSERARIRAASLTKSYPKDSLSWYFQHALLTAGTPAAVRSCNQMLPHIDNKTIRARLADRLGRPLPDTNAIAIQVLAALAPFKAEGNRILAETALADGDYTTALINLKEPAKRYDAMLASGDVESAREYLDSLPQTNPRNNLAHAKFYHALNRPVTALSLLNKSQGTPDSAMLKAKILFEQHEVNTCKATLVDLIKENPRNLAARSMLMDVYVIANESTAANELYATHVQQTLPAWILPSILNRINQRPPILSLYRLSQSNTIEALQPPSRSVHASTFSTLPTATAALAQEGRAAAARALIARFSRMAALSTAEKRQLARAAAQIPDTALAHNYYLSAAEIDDSKVQATLIEWLKWATAESPNSSPLDLLQKHPERLQRSVKIPAAKLALKLNQPDVAAAFLDGIKPTAESLAVTGRIAEARNATSNAKEAYKKALKMDAQQPDARLGLAAIATSWALAGADLSTAIREMPKDPNVLIRAAQIAAKHDRHREVVRYALGATEYSANNTNIAAIAGDLLLQVGAWQDLQELISTHRFLPDDLKQLQLRLAFLIGDKNTQMDLMPQLTNRALVDPELAITLIRSAMEINQRTTALRIAASLNDKKNATDRETAASRLPESRQSPAAAAALAELAQVARWVALAAAEADHLPTAQRETALATALSDSSPWQFPDLRAAARLADSFPSTALQKLLERQESTTSLPPATGAEILRAIGIIHTKFGNPKKAIDWYRRSLRIKPDVQVEILLAQAYGASGDGAKAEQILSPLSQSMNPEIRAKLTATRRILEHHQFLKEHARQKMIMLYEAGGHVAAADLLLALDNWSDAHEEIAKKLLNTQLSERRYQKLSTRLSQQGASDFGSTSLLAVQTRLGYLLDQDDYVGARKLLQEAVRATNANALRLQLAAICQQLGWQEEAAKHQLTAAKAQLSE